MNALTCLLAFALLGATPAGAIMAGSASGNPPDSPADRVDPNTTGSTWAGVGSLSVGGGTFTAVAIGQRYVLTAGHVAKGANPANMKFNLSYGGSANYQLPAAAVFAHPAFVSFGKPDSQHDIAIVELAQDIPTGVPIYPLHFDSVAPGTRFVMVGYGGSGQGDVGASVGGNGGIKRAGSNNADRFVPDVDGSGRSALFLFDFDGGMATNYLGGPTLGNRVETGLASGDSGSPSFIFAGGQWKVAGINTYIFTFSGGPSKLSTFGTGGGGNLLWPYQAWIDSILSRPGNDTFANRFALAGAGGTLRATNIGATKEAGEPSHAGAAGGTSVWWKWTAPRDREITIDTGGSGFDTLVAVYTGTAVGALTLIAAGGNPASGNNSRKVAFTAQAGTEYQIAVDGLGAASGEVVLHWGDPTVSAQIPALPAWGVAVLAFALAAVAARLHKTRRLRH